MGFTLFYRSTKPVSNDRAAAIRKAADALNERRSWLSCEPINFFEAQEIGRMLGGSKPSFHPHPPEDVASASLEGLPDGTVQDLVQGLCQLSRDHGVDWEFSHDYDPGPIGFIRGGVCDKRLLAQIEAFAGLAEDLSNFGEETYGSHPPEVRRSATNRDDVDEDDPPILKLWPSAG